jgi:hypothetical protein
MEDVGVSEEVSEIVGVTVDETEIDEDVEGVDPKERDPVGVKEIVGVIEGVPEKDAPSDIVEVVEGEIEGVFVAEFEAVGDGETEGAAARVKPVDDKV